MEDIQLINSTVKMPLMNLPVRSVVVRCQNHKILISPGSALTAEVYQQHSGITDIVGPSLFHCAGLMGAQQFYSEAKIWAPLGAEKHKPELATANKLGRDPWPFEECLQVIPLHGVPQIKEFLFFHKKSKSLIVADLCFNLTQVQGLGAWFILSLFGTYRKLGVSRFFLRFVKDRAAFEESLRFVMRLDFENLIVSHGDLVQSHAKDQLLRAFNSRGFLLSQ